MLTCLHPNTTHIEHQALCLQAVLLPPCGKVVSVGVRPLTFKAGLFPLSHFLNFIYLCVHIHTYQSTLQHTHTLPHLCVCVLIVTRGLCVKS